MQAAFESSTDLQEWITDSPDDATVEAFTTFAQQLSGALVRLSPWIDVLNDESNQIGA